MRRIIVAGIGTDVGKTIASAICVQALQADYWKPIQTGNILDRETVQKLVSVKKAIFHKELFLFNNPVSPHCASEIEKVPIKTFDLPIHQNSLIIEPAGGVYVPLSNDLLFIDIASRWDCEWIIVSKHYLGSINHTLLTIDALQKRKIPLIGIIFNGSPEPCSEKVILSIGKCPRFARLLPEKNISLSTIKRYASLWKKTFF